MRCPTDGTTLQLADRHGIEIDYCPDCRGVWLDRGELDKVIARSADERVDDRAGRRDGRPWRDDDDRYDDVPGGGRKRKRRSFLDDVFDFG